MTLISYAQNSEDIMLWRALGHITEGFFIDVGAAWPTLDSVTKLFSDHGWRGINIEPNPTLHAELVAARRNDINLPIALADVASTMRMNIVVDTGLSTLDPAIAELHQSAGRDVEIVEVQVSTLEDVWERHVPVNQQVHFLKIDVEGFEEAVLRGARLDVHRPWIVVIEATVPASQTDNFRGWEPLVVDSAYTFAYADGLNRFYVADEHAELAAAFSIPPNVFDGFVPRVQAEAEAHAAAADVWAANEAKRFAETEEGLAEHISILTERLAGAEKLLFERTRAVAEAHRRSDAAIAQLAATNAETHEALSAAWARNHELDQHIQSIYHSHSWKLAAPLRVVTATIRGTRALPGRVSQLAKRIVGMPLSAVIGFVRARPKLETMARSALAHIPGVHDRFYRFGAGRGLVDEQTASIVATHEQLAAESASTRHVHQQLRRALAEHADVS